MKDICFIIPNFNQLSFLKNLVAQLKFYYPHNRIYVIDNGSTNSDLLTYYYESRDFQAYKYPDNDFVGNLSSFIEHYLKFEYYVISDPDISIPPYTPPYFLEVFRQAIDQEGFHHAGFGLKTDDIPKWNPKAAWIAGDEKNLLNTPVTIDFKGEKITGFRAPIDTTFALYKKSNGGWTAPMSGEAWNNSVRFFEVFHLFWYLHKDYLNDEIKHYLNTCLKRDNSLPSAGRNHYNPFTGMD